MSASSPGSVSSMAGRPAQPQDPLRDSFLELQQAESLRMQGQLDRARSICESLAGRYPEYFGALYTLGLIYADQNLYPQAFGCLARASMLNPRSWQALTALSLVYLELGATEMAAHALERAIRIKPEDPSILLTLGQVYYEEREYDLARDSYRKAYELDRTLEPAALGFAKSSIDLGQYAEASEILRDLFRCGKRSIGAAHLLNYLPESFAPPDVLSELEKVTPDSNEDKAEFANSLAFIRAAALHRERRYSEAWAQLVDANRNRFHAVEQEWRELSATQQANLAQLGTKRIKAKRGSRSFPISLFILGPSRSGKTTVETLVGTLDGVKRGYENPSVEKAVRRTFQSAGLLSSNLFEVLSPRLDAQCCENYLEELTRRAGSAKVFTNTHPGRIHDAARVAAAFPAVRFIFVKRDLEDNALRIYMRKYQSGNAYAYDLESIREHLVWYHQMIDLLMKKLPDITRLIHYEDMVADPAGTLRVAAELCGLPMQHGPLPDIGDDRGCAEPYRDFMASALEH